MSVFKVKSVAVEVDSLKFFRDSKYDLLYKTFKLLATARQETGPESYLFLIGMRLCKHTSELDRGSGRHIVRYVGTE